MIINEDPNEHDANKYFFILKMAIEVGGNKLRVQVLSCIQVNFFIISYNFLIFLNFVNNIFKKLISHEFLDGNCEDNCIYPEDAKPDPANSKYPRKLIDAIIESI